MVAINNYSVSLSLDAGNYIKNSSLSRTETNRLKRSIDQARTPMERYQLEVKRLERAWMQGAIDMKTYNRLLDEQKHKLQSTGKATSGLTTRLAGMAAGYLSVSTAVNVLRDGIQGLASLEQSKVAFEVLLKDADLATKLLQNLRDFAARTPFSQEEIVNSARSLLAFGFSASEVNKQLTTLGNISSATGSRFSELADVIGKMRVQGVIMSEDLNQLAGRGINVFDGLAKRLGITTDRVKEFASQRKIAFDDLDAVLTEIGNNEFGGLMAKQAETLQGKWSTFNDELKQTKMLMAEMAVGTGESAGGILAMMGQFRRGLGLLTGSTQRSEAQALADAQLEAATTARRLRELRGRRRVQPKEFSAAGTALSFGISAVEGFDFQGAARSGFNAGGMAGQGLMAGFQQLGTSILGGFKFHTEKLAKTLDTSLVPSLEKGSEAAANAILQAQNRQLNGANSPEKTRERQMESLIQTGGRQVSLLEEQLHLWKNDPPMRPIR